MANKFTFDVVEKDGQDAVRLQIRLGAQVKHEQVVSVEEYFEVSDRVEETLAARDAARREAIRDAAAALKKLPGDAKPAKVEAAKRVLADALKRAGYATYEDFLSTESVAGPAAAE